MQSRISSRWEELAIYLYVDRATVEGIQRERGGETTIWCLNRLLAAWLRMQPSPTQCSPSGKVLCDAVSFIDKPLSLKMWTNHASTCSLCGSLEVMNPTTTCLADIQTAAAPVPGGTTTTLTERRVGAPTTSTLRERIAPTTTLTAERVAPTTALTVADLERVIAPRTTTLTAAVKLKELFDEFLRFLISQLHYVNIETLRLSLTQFFTREEELNEEMEEHLLRIEQCPTSVGVLNYFVNHKFIGYVNYSLIKIFQETVKSSLLDENIEKYNKDYQGFLKLSLTEIHNAFQHCPDLHPDYPTGLPKFTVQLQSNWYKKSMYSLKEFLVEHCFNADRDCVDQFMIAEINLRNDSTIVTFAVLPHIARNVIGYLTNDDVIMAMEKRGMTAVNINKKLMKYKELDNITVLYIALHNQIN